MVVDINIPLPRNPKPRYDQTRNHRFDFGALGGQLCEYVADIVAVAFDAR